MKTEFEAWIVRREGSVPLDRFEIQGDLRVALFMATLKMKFIGAKVAEARNLSWFQGVPSLLVYDPSFPVAVILKGAQLTDEKGNPLRGKAARTGFSPLVPPINE